MHCPCTANGCCVRVSVIRCHRLLPLLSSGVSCDSAKVPEPTVMAQRKKGMWQHGNTAHHWHSRWATHYGLIATQIDKRQHVAASQLIRCSVWATHYVLIATQMINKHKQRPTRHTPPHTSLSTQELSNNTIFSKIPLPHWTSCASEGSLNNIWTIVQCLPITACLPITGVSFALWVIHWRVNYQINWCVNVFIPPASKQVSQDVVRQMRSKSNKHLNTKDWRVCNPHFNSDVFKMCKTLIWVRDHERSLNTSNTGVRQHLARGKPPIPKALYSFMQHKHKQRKWDAWCGIAHQQCIDCNTNTSNAGVRCDAFIVIDRHLNPPKLRPYVFIATQTQATQMRCVMRNSSPTMYWLQHKHKQRRCEMWCVLAQRVMRNSSAAARSPTRAKQTSSVDIC